MLETLHIQDYALIEDLEVEFRPGFNVLTGETGAGKSIVVGALGLALGGRASSETIRSGAQKAVVEVVFRLEAVPQGLAALLEELDIPLDDSQLILSRTVAADGRGRALVNGRTVPVATLAAIGDELVDLHGQHEHQSLLRQECQMRLLDAFAGAETIATEVARLVGAISKIKADILRLETDDRERARQADFMRYEVAEIDGAALAPGEENELRERLHLITHAETINRLAADAYTALYESETVSALDALNTALKDLEELERIDASFRELSKQIAGARADVESAATELLRFTNRLEFDPEEINELNSRLTIISALKRKYGTDITAILAYRQKVAAALAEYDNRDALLETMRAEYDRLMVQAMGRAAELSTLRRRGASTMDKQALHFLHALDMPNARFETRLEPADLNACGVDKVVFMLSANAGEPLKPLRQVASGGEISRIMLALKAVFAEQDTVPTLVFDEIDAGIGGATARRVSDTLAGLSGKHQVLCITHLAQIAAPARAHYMVVKSQAENTTTTSVLALSGADREKEIARLLDGSVSAASLKHAKALLTECG
jgi:DNA repair protein RecN (Recombination protein N)